MAIRGWFVGIDEFTDPVAPSLTGAKRDAAALHAIFKDGIPDLEDTLLLNAEATYEHIRQCLTNAFEGANEDDAVIFTFATHGTEDHRIVAHNTDVHKLDDTAIPLADIVSLFRNSRARFILCILDCCFSGEAPARVVKDTPKSRSLFDISAIQGAGRLLITACRPNEEAFEHPSRRHGLLTAALVDALTNPESSSVLTLVDRVVSQVRTEAETMGLSQNPVATTYIDGGFVLPTLRRGATFAAAFPEYGAVRVATVADLRQFGIPQQIVEAWRDAFHDHLHQLQIDAINEYRILDGQSLFVIAPTSSGKTFIGEVAGVRAVLDGRRAVFLLPLKALVNEKYDDFRRMYGEQLGMRVVRCSGDYHDELSAFVSGKFDIALLTYEMFLGIALTNESLLNLLGLVVVDEVQYVSDASRGINVELLLTLLRAKRGIGINPQLLLLSAVVGNADQFADWLGIRISRSETRPVPLRFGAIDRSGMFEFVDENGVRKIEQMLRPDDIRPRHEKASAQDVIIPLTRQLLSEPRASVIVFRNMRSTAAGAAGYLAAEMGLPAATEAIELLPSVDLSNTSPLLRSALNGGTAFHSTHLSRDERVVVERAFRQGTVRVLAATSGVAAGINTPASAVIIAETTLAAPNDPPMQIGDMRNMAGRAGRYGYQETGTAFMIASSSWQRTALVDQYVVAAAPPLRSTFDTKDIPTWTIRLLRQVDRIQRADVPPLLMNSFGGYIASRQNPAFNTTLGNQVTGLLATMQREGLLEEDASGIELTDIGKACGAANISLESCLVILAAIRHLNRPLTPEQLAALTQIIIESEESRIPINRRTGSSEYRWLSEAAARFGNDVASVIQRGVAQISDAWARAKKALVVVAYASGMPISDIENRFTMNARFYLVRAGDITGTADNTRYRLRSIVDLIQIAYPAFAPDPVAMENLFVQIELGISSDILDLAESPVPLNRAACLSLRSAEIRTVDALLHADPEKLKTILPSITLQALIPFLVQ